MVYLFNTYFPAEKKLAYALSKICGLGIHQSLQICYQLGLSEYQRVGHLTQEDFERLNEILTENYEIGNQVSRTTNQNIQRLLEIASYRGFRHSQGLPSRGQRTHGNSRTARKFKRGIQYSKVAKK